MMSVSGLGMGRGGTFAVLALNSSTTVFTISRDSANPSVLTAYFFTDMTIIYRFVHLGRHSFSYSDLTVEIQ